MCVFPYLPGLNILPRLVWHGVEERPEGGVAAPVVVQVEHQGVGDHHGLGLTGFKAFKKEYIFHKGRRKKNI